MEKALPTSPGCTRWISLPVIYYKVQWSRLTTGCLWCTQCLMVIKLINTFAAFIKWFSVSGYLYQLLGSPYMVSSLWVRKVLGRIKCSFQWSINFWVIISAVWFTIHGVLILVKKSTLYQVESSVVFDGPLKICYRPMGWVQWGDHNYERWCLYHDMH